MATKKPSRRDYPAGRAGASKYAAAVRAYNQSQARRSESTASSNDTRNRRGRVTSRTARTTPTESRRRGMSNINPAEGMVNNPDYGKPGTGYTAEQRIAAEQNRAFRQGASGAGSRGAQSGTSSPQSSTSQAAIRAEYDRLRKAGKTKEAEAYGKKIAKELAAKAPKNPYRVPQGSERRDRFSRDVAELRGMGKGSTSSRARTYTDKEQKDIQRYGSRGGNAVTRQTSSSTSSGRTYTAAEQKQIERYGDTSGRAVTRNTKKTKSGDRTTTTRARSNDPKVGKSYADSKRNPNTTPKSNKDMQFQPSRSKKNSETAKKLREMLNRRRGM